MADEESPGWGAIDDHLAATIRPGEPDRHWAAVPHFAAGGSDLLDGISAYALGEEALYVSYGLSDLYEKSDPTDSESGYGFELTLAVPHVAGAEFPKWPWGMMQYLARYVFSSGNVLLSGQFLDGRAPIDGGSTEIEGCVFAVDPILGEIETVHGSVRFLRVVGATRPELDAMRAGERTGDDLLGALQEHDAGLMTDLGRTGSLL